MLRQTFSGDDKIQVLDPTTFIWESAKIISYVSDWCVRIKWTEWPGIKHFDLTVPEKDRDDKVSTITIIQKLNFVIKFEI